MKGGQENVQKDSTDRIDNTIRFPMERVRPSKAQKDKKQLLKNTSDFWIIILVMVLVVIGLIMVYDASYYVAQQSAAYDHDGAYFLKNQLYGFGVGIVAMIALAFWDYKKWRKLVFFVLFVAVVLMALVWVPGVGQKINGANRWIKIWRLPSIQPSEPAKFAVILYLAHLFTLRENEMGSLTRTVFPALLVTGIFAVMLFKQPNMSMLMTYLMLMLLMYFMAGGKWYHVIGMIAVGIGVFLLAWRFHPHVAARMDSYLHPEEDPLNSGYQTMQSLYAIADGKWFGVGFGNSKQKFLYLPYRESDFIFSIFAEEFGFVGCTVLLSIYALLIWRCVLVFRHMKERFGRILAIGITLMLGIQVFLNVGVVTGMIPATGLPLPFISAGGTSLTIFLAEIGVLLNISKQSGAHKRPVRKAAKQE